jgi:ligand-binding sensor domain-containing protein
MRVFLIITMLLLCLNPSAQVTRVELPKELFAFTFKEDAQGVVWLGLSDGGIEGTLATYSNNELQILTPEDGVPRGSYHVSLALPDGSMFFGGTVMGKTGHPILAWVSSMGVDTITIPFLLRDPMINCITLVDRRDVWIGTANGLLVNRRGMWQRITTHDGLPHMVVNDIHQDFRKLVWVATEGGIVYYDDNEMQIVGARSRAINLATNLHSDTYGYLWAGARFLSEGVSVFNGMVWDTFTSRNGLIDNSTAIFFQQSPDALWVGSCYHRSRGGVSFFDGTKWQSFAAPDYLAKPCTDAIAMDTKGRVWFGGSLSTSRHTGITILDGEQWHRVGNCRRLPAERVIEFFNDSQGRLWISSFEGLFIVDSEAKIEDVK